MASSTCKHANAKIHRREDIKLPKIPRDIGAVPSLSPLCMRVLEKIPAGGIRKMEVARILGYHTGTVLHAIDFLTSIGLLEQTALPFSRAHIVYKTGDKPDTHRTMRGIRTVRILAFVAAAPTTTRAISTHMEISIKCAGDWVLELRAGSFIHTEQAGRAHTHTITEAGRKLLKDMRAKGYA